MKNLAEVIKTGDCPEMWEVRDKLGYTVKEFTGEDAKRKAQHYARTHEI